MKNYLQAHNSDNLSYNQLRVAVREAWDSIDENVLDNLISEMKSRSWAVIRVNGLYTR
jgi:hypothetical protein